jgi:cell division protein FtsB
MYQSLGVLLLVACCQAAQIMRFNGQMPSMGRSKRDISLAVSGSCVVTGNQLFANGFAVRQLNDTEQEMMQQYQQDLQQYKSTRQQLQAQLQNVTMRRIRGQQLTQDEQEALQQLRNLDPPSAPAFCSGNDTTLYIFDGCMVQDNKVYVGDTYARDLTSDETQQLQNFLQQIDAYMQYKQNQFDQKMSQFASKMQSMFGGFGTSENQDDGEMSITTTPENGDGPALFPSPPFPSSSPSSSLSPSNNPAPTFPTPPQLCYSF